MSTVDTREPKWRTEPLRRAGWKLEALKYGDYQLCDAVGKSILIEHKTVDKMIADMQSGILQRQCRTLAEHSTFPILMVEGSWKQSGGYLLGRNITWEQAWNQLQTIQDMGCRLQLTTSKEHTIQRLFELELYYSKEKHASAYRELSGDATIAALCLIPGIEVTKAKALKAIYPELGDIAKSSETEYGRGRLMEARGIGEVLTQRIYNFFWEENNGSK